MQEHGAMESISEFFSGKNIFITGGSGFMGKVLIEKLLRSCPDIGNIYILVRPKRGVDINGRINEITNNILFDTIKKTNKGDLKKIVPIAGDMKEINLGISEENRKTLTNEVSIVYHVAATVRFNSTLSDAIIMNVRGTREVCKLVMDLKNAPILVHVSTAYCQQDKVKVEEKIYPSPANWEEMITIAETMDISTLNLLTAKYAEGFPNTYTFSKALAESVVADICGNKISTIIFRPTIVVSAYRDPIPGWCDNLNGPIGITAASAKGVLRSTYVSSGDKRIDFIPVDITINGLIIATWKHKQKNISVYNASNNNGKPITTSDFKEIGTAVGKEVYTLGLWYPNAFTTSNKLIHLIHIYLFQILPAIFIDVVLRIFTQKPRLLKLQRKLFVVLRALEYFVVNEWDFKNDKFLNLDDVLLPQDKLMFAYDMDDIDPFSFFKTAALMGQKLLFHEDERHQDLYRMLSNVLWVIHHVTRTIASIIIILFIYNSLIVPISDRLLDYLIGV